MQAAFKPDAQTTVTAVKAFKKGDPLLLSGKPDAKTEIAQNDLCMVKINVGPGNPGPADAPSTSRGIGIEIWLPSPANWNSRTHNLGGGGFQGAPNGDPDSMYNGGLIGPSLAKIAGTEGAVTSFTDTGHVPDDGSFAMNPDGSINEALWRDFSDRSLYEQAVKTKALATAYYGRPPKFSYWDGGSTGGRQGLKLAQEHPELFDGIVALYPAINFTRFIAAEVWPQLVFQRDLGGIPLSAAQQNLMSNAAIKACDVVGGQHLGYILDNAACRYDPTTDKSVLCTANGGTNSSAACVTPKQAAAMNKIWYGPTTDGSVPAPAKDNGWAYVLPAKRLWFGLPRGTATTQGVYDFGPLPGVANPQGPFSLSTDMMALLFQDTKLAEPSFKNATGNGASAWKSLSYAQYAKVFELGAHLQPQFGHIETNNPDLSAFEKRGGKMITGHGFNDELIPVQGTINYYNRVVKQMGGLNAVQRFYRLYLIPGFGHETKNGTANRSVYPPYPGIELYYRLITDWVEKGIAPDRQDISSPPGAPSSISQPICVFPKAATYKSGDPFKAASYVCS